MSHVNTPILKAALWMTGTIGSFCAMAVAGREVSHALDTFEIMTYRSLVGFLIISSLLTFSRRWHEVRTRVFGTHVIRNVAHFTGQNLWFYAMTLIPLAQVFALEFTSPLWVIVLSPLILGERLTRVRVLAAIMGFIGILIVARPNPSALSPGLIAAASSAIFFALTFMFTKKLTRTESILRILFWLTAMQLVFGLATSAYDGDMAIPPPDTVGFVILIGLAGLLAHLCLTKALSLAPATVVVPIDFVRLPAIAIIGMLLYHEPIDIWVFLGAALIFAGNYMNILRENRNAS